MSVLSLDEHLRSPGWHRRDRQPNESSPPTPVPSSFLDVNLGLVQFATPSTFTGSGGTNRDSFGESGPPSPPLSGDTSRPTEPPFVSDLDKQALQLLVCRAVPQDELPSVIESIVSNVKAIDIVNCLHGTEVQAFIDVVDEVRHRAIPPSNNWFIDFHSDLLIPVDQALDTFDFASRIRRKCIKSLYKMCACHAMIPYSLHFELCESVRDAPLCHGGSADVSKHKHGSREVAVKVLRVRGNLRDMTNVSAGELLPPRTSRLIELNLCRSSARRL